VALAGYNTLVTRLIATVPGMGVCCAPAETGTTDAKTAKKPISKYFFAVCVFLNPVVVFESDGNINGK
jgi:hypothetical protein